jgi:hypothetical protein
MNIALALLLYPGLALTLLLALVFRVLAEGQYSFRSIRVPAFGIESAAAYGSIGLASLALSLLPWPLHLAAPWAWIGNPLLVWLILEGAFLIVALPGLLTQNPLAVRATSRETQIGVAGRTVLWLAIGIALWQETALLLPHAPGRVLLILGGILALPAALGLGAFGAERSLAASGAELGLDEATAGLLRFARAARGSALLAAFVLTAIPRGQVQVPFVLLLFVAGFVVLALGMQQLSRSLPRFTLPAALSWCWWRALPFVVAGMVYLAFVP